MPRVLYALLICSDEDCTESFEASGSLEELEALACDCGCALEVIAVCEEDPAASRLELARVG